MSANEAFNIASLKMVHDELLATIEQSALRLEQFASDRTNGELLQNCIEGVRQIRGTLSLIQLKGVDLLADELLEHINDITLGDNPSTDKRLELLTSAFFMLPRYLEFCLQTSRSMPLLLIPHINELRQARRASPLPESYYFSYQPLKISRIVEGDKTAPTQENLSVLVRRLRHMYQAGLLKILQGTQIKPSFSIMCRALERLESVCGATALGNLWWLANAALSAVCEENLRITKSRKMLLSSLDREIKRLQFEGTAVMNREPDIALIKELLYLLTLSKSSTEKTKAVTAAYALPSLTYGDTELAREMEFLRGPSINTINSMVAVLTDELHSTKNILERAAQSGAELLSESPELLDTLKKIADILAIVGLASPSNGLKQEIEKIQRWQTSGEAVNSTDLLGVADTLLYVESTIAGLGKTNLSDEKLAQINALSRDDAMANNQIAEAEKLVLDEIESGLSLVKRALSAFAESNYDKAHIANISATLDSVRGGMFVLGLPRAAKVIAGCIKFIEDSLMEDEQQAAIQHMMDTFADAIISLEYYLDNVKVDKNADTDVLAIAGRKLGSFRVQGVILVQDEHAHYVVADEQFLCTEKGVIALLNNTQIASLGFKVHTRQLLKGQRVEDVAVHVEYQDVLGFQWRNLRSLVESESEEEFQAAGRALQILRWHYDHQYCGRCGKPTEQHKNDFAKVCTACRIDFYPRLSPCVIMLVTRGDECLLAWHTRSKEEKYSCLAGFIEVGESPEHTLVREVKEEVGINVTNLRYVASQPWPFPGQLMLGYFADYASGDIVVDKAEIVVARWYRFDQLPKIPPASTISGRLIGSFVQERQDFSNKNKS